MSQNAGRQPTVLIVGDDELIRMAAVDELNERGLEALGARHAMAALSILESNKPVDLLITDIGLPGLDGRRLAEMARALRPSIGIMFLTGYPIDPNEAAPGMRFVEKPIDLNLLARLVETMLEDQSGSLIHP